MSGPPSSADSRQRHRADAAGEPAPPASGAPPLWKLLLALLSLTLSLVLWLEGLVGSLERPSVIDALSLRQLELAVIAEDRIPGGLRPLLVGDDPTAALIEELDDQLETSEVPLPAVRRLERILLKQQTAPDRAREAELRQLLVSVDIPRRPLLESLLAGRPLAGDRLDDQLAPWKAPQLVEQLSCEQLARDAQRCGPTQAPQLLILRLLSISVIPALMLLLGLLLLLRQLWRWRRGAVPAAPPLRGPPLGLVDVILLIAGGFVIVGEILAPVLLQVPLAFLLERLQLEGSLEQAVQVVVLYLGLMAAPLGILSLMLGPAEERPAAGWLQWRWRSLRSNLGWAVSTVLMVLPFVALAGWLIERLWGNPGGSNPLLDLVLTSSNPLALIGFAFTAVILAPLFEETLFRGVLLPVLGRRLGAPQAVLISAVVFAVAHLSLSESVPLLLLGIGLGWIRWRSGSLAASVLMHSLWNGITFLNLLVLAG